MDKKLYWSTNTGVRHLNGIFRTDPDAHNRYARPVDVIAHSVENQTNITHVCGGMAFHQDDPSGKELYWIDPQWTCILRVELESPREPEVYLQLDQNPGGIPDRETHGLAIHEDQLYWTDTPSRLIQRAPIREEPIDSTHIQTLYTEADGVIAPIGIALDSKTEMLHWVNNSNQHPSIPGRMAALQSAPINGQGPINDDVPGPSNCRGVAVDDRDATVYWTDTVGKRIMKKAAGAIPEVFVGGLPGQPQSVAVGIDPNDATHRRLYWGYGWPSEIRQGHGIQWVSLDDRLTPGCGICDVLATLWPVALAVRPW